jgi:hypothetical protein
VFRRPAVRADFLWCPIATPRGAIGMGALVNFFKAIFAFIGKLFEACGT